MLQSLFARVQDRAALRLAFHTLHDKVPALCGVALVDGDPRHGARIVDGVGRDAVSEQVGDSRFRVGATAFFQVSGLAAARLTSLILDGARLTGTERVLELYSVVGTFTVPLAKGAREVVGVEGSPAAAADGATNLRDHACTNALIVAAPVEHALPGLAAAAAWDLVVLDPPGQGCNRGVLDHVTATKAARVIYVSCDPSTLARDLGALVRAGYRCTSLRPIDLFPQTFHLESVAVVER